MRVKARGLIVFSRKRAKEEVEFFVFFGRDTLSSSFDDSLFPLHSLTSFSISSLRALLVGMNVAGSRPVPCFTC